MRSRVTGFARAAGLALTVLAGSTPALAAEPVLAIWYRGNPSGVPLASDLAVIRVLGFTGVAWPRRENDAGRVTELERLAKVAGLRVLLVDRPSWITGRSALTPGGRGDVAVKGLAPGAMTALVWRAVAHGTRTITFDAGAPHGTGLEHADRSLTPWAREAVALARQLLPNTRAIDLMRPGPGVVMTPVRAPDLDVVLLDAGRSWVLVATNTSGAEQTTSVRMPSGVPYALWLSWIDGTTLAMIGEPAGPRWTLRMAPHSARVYVIDKPH